MCGARIEPISGRRGHLVCYVIRVERRILLFEGLKKKRDQRRKERIDIGPCNVRMQPSCHLLWYFKSTESILAQNNVWGEAEKQFIQCKHVCIHDTSVL
jgi:hypothetical protein